MSMTPALPQEKDIIADFETAYYSLLNVAHTLQKHYRDLAYEYADLTVRHRKALISLDEMDDRGNDPYAWLEDFAQEQSQKGITHV